MTRGPRLILHVQDNGKGIDPHYHERIFDMFQTLTGNGSAETTGLGLAFVKRAANIIGGHVTISAAEGKGSVFTVTLNSVVLPGLAAEVAA